MNILDSAAANARRRLPAAPLGKSINAHMEEASMVAWRRSYRQYRLGQVRGPRESSRFWETIRPNTFGEG